MHLKTSATLDKRAGYTKGVRRAAAGAAGAPAVVPVMLLEAVDFVETEGR